MPYVFVAVSCLAGVLVLFKALPRAAQYRQPLRYIIGIVAIAASLMGWPLLMVLVFLPDEANGAFLILCSLVGFVFTSAWGADRVSRADNTPRDDLRDGIHRLFS